MRAETAIEKQSSAVTAYNRMPAWVMPMVKSAVLLADAALVVVCFVAAFTIREGEQVLSDTAWSWSKQFVPYAGILYFAIFIRIGMLIYQRAYSFQGAFTYTQEALKIFKAIFVSSLLIVAWAFLFRGGYAFREFSYSRAVFVIDFAIALVAFTAFHFAVRFAQTHFRDRGINLIPTLIVGTNAEAEQTIGQLQERPDLGYRVIGVVRTEQDDAARDSASFADITIAGEIDDLAAIITDLKIQEVIITDKDVERERLFEAMMEIGRKHRVEFRFAPSLFNLLPQKTSVEQIGVLPMVRLFREPLSDAQRFLKRTSDLVIAALAIVLTAPLWVVVALLIKRDSPGPVFFRQERVGMDGRIFLCLKFRTMYQGTDDDLHRQSYQKHILGEVDANAGNQAAPVFGKVRDDPRITNVGRWLRRSSLDELPQLINVIRGEMSVVGPRPPIPYEVEGYDVSHRKRLDMKPGITGLWQVSGRNRLTFGEMVRVDLYYIENWSIWLDLKILFLTLPAIARDDGAR